MFIISLSPFSILQSSPLLYSASLSPIPTVSGHVSKSSIGIAISSSIYFHHIRVSSGSPHYFLSLSSSHYYCICSLNSLHWSRPCCHPLRWHFLPLLPHLGSWQYLSLFLLFRSCSSLLFSSPQPFLLSPTLSPISF